MGTLKKLRTESFDDVAKGGLGLVAQTLLVAKGVPAETAAWAPVFAGATHPWIREGVFRTLRQGAILMRQVGRRTGRTPKELSVELNADPKLRDMVTLILREIETSESDPEHLNHLADVFSYGVEHPDERATARQLLKVLEGLSSSHVRLLRMVAGPSPRGEWPGGWSGKELHGDGTNPAIQFSAAMLAASGLIEMGGVAEFEDDDGSITLDDSALSVTQVGRWVLEVLDHYH